MAKKGGNGKYKGNELDPLLMPAVVCFVIFIVVAVLVIGGHN